MKCILFLAAQNILIDFQSKRARAINIMEDMVSPTFPFLLSLSTLSFFEREGEEGDEVFYLEGKIGETVILPKFKLEIFIDKETKGAKNLVNMGAIIIPEPGKLSLAISNIENDVKASLSINILTYTQQPNIA